MEGWSAEVSFFTFGSNVIITEHFLVTWSPEELPDQNISVSHGVVQQQEAYRGLTDETICKDF